jgi:hypothetical protein
MESLMNLRLNSQNVFLVPALIGFLLSHPRVAYSTPADDDFKARCDAPGVLKCMGFDTDAGLEGKQGGAKVDKELKVSGSGSMFVDIGPSASSAPGNVVVKLGADIKEGSALYLQWRQRFSPSMVSTNLGGEGFKQIVIYDAQPGGNVEVAMLNLHYVGYPSFYTAMGASYFEKKLAGGDVTRQWHGDTVICTEKDKSKCMKYQPDQWMTFYYEQHIGKWGQPNSTVKVWWGAENKPLTQFIDISDYTFKSESASSAYRTIWIGPYSLGRSGSGFAQASTWFDEFIISKEPIKAPLANTPTRLHAFDADTHNDGLKVLANPFNSSMTISFPNADHNADVSVYDMRGDLVKDLGRAKTDRIEWKTDGLSKGLYLIKVNNQKESISRKVSILK